MSAGISLWSHQRRLLQKIVEGLSAPVTVVEGPVGSGKSTAVSAAIAEILQLTTTSRILIIGQGEAEVNGWVTRLDRMTSTQPQIVDARWLRRWQLHQSSQEGEGGRPSRIYVATATVLLSDLGKRFAEVMDWQLIVVGELDSDATSWEPLQEFIEDVEQVIVLSTHRNGDLRKDWEKISWWEMSLLGRVRIRLVEFDLTSAERRIEQLLRAAVSRSGTRHEYSGLTSHNLYERWRSSLSALDTSVRRISSKTTTDLRTRSDSDYLPDIGLDMVEKLIEAIDAVQTDSRMEAVLRSLGEDGEPGPRLVFTQYADSARGLRWRPELEHESVFLLTGETRPEEREQVVQECASSNGVLISTTAPLKGLELKGFSRILHLDVPSGRILLMRLMHVRPESGDIPEHTLIVMSDEKEALQHITGLVEMARLRDLGTQGRLLRGTGDLETPDERT